MVCHGYRNWPFLPALVLACLLIALALARAEDKPRPKLVCQTYSVADLVIPIPEPKAPGEKKDTRHSNAS